MDFASALPAPPPIVEPSRAQVIMHNPATAEPAAPPTQPATPPIPAGTQPAAPAAPPATPAPPANPETPAAPPGPAPAAPQPEAPAPHSPPEPAKNGTGASGPPSPPTAAQESERIAALERQVSEMRANALKNALRDARIVRDDYMKLAPQVDVTTPEGKAEVAKFIRENPSLFAGTAPAAPAPTEFKPPEVRNPLMQGFDWGQIRRS